MHEYSIWEYAAPAEQSGQNNMECNQSLLE